MKLTAEPFTVHKRVPLTISRGTTGDTTNLWLRVEEDGIEGWGEAVPFSIGADPQTTDMLMDAVEHVRSAVAGLSLFDRQTIEERMSAMKVPSALRCGMDMALLDWMGKCVGQPVWRVWGLDAARRPPLSVTIGICSPDTARERARDWLDHVDVRVLKVKLGSPRGIAADRAMLDAIRDEAPADVRIYVDANGGWSLEDAIAMCRWLKDRDVAYVEQPLHVDRALRDMPELHADSPVPLFIDESCFSRMDIPVFAHGIDGINIKLMKSGGLSEALRMIHTARALGLQVMIGCYSDSSLANTAGAHLGPLVDYLDLDSHLNLLDDPFVGAEVRDGRLALSDAPGFGVERNA